MSLAQALPDSRPISDLRTHLPEIESEARKDGEPIVLTRNGKPSLILFDFNAYNNQIKLDRHIQKLREAEIEERYRSDSYSFEQSKARLAEIKQAITEHHA